MINLMPGDVVTVFDRKLFIDDIKTPLNITMQKAIIVKRYGIIKSVLGYRYEDLIDVVFLHDGRLSKGHFTERARKELICL